MRYWKYTGRIDCDNDKCGEWHCGGHDLDGLITGDTLETLDGFQCCLGCGNKFSSPSTTMDQMTVGGSHGHCLIEVAARIARRFGMIDGAHHKQWVIDQMLRTILGREGYQTWINQMNADPEYDEWDVGIAP